MAKEMMSATGASSGVMVSFLVELGTKLLETTRDYLIARQINKTERERIHAVLEACLERIRANQKAVEQYLNFQFKHKKELYDQFFGCLRMSIERNQPELVQLFMSHIQVIYSEDPVKGIQQLASVQSGLSIRSLNSGEDQY